MIKYIKVILSKRLKILTISPMICSISLTPKWWDLKQEYNPLDFFFFFLHLTFLVTGTFGGLRGQWNMTWQASHAEDALERLFYSTHKHNHAHVVHPSACPTSSYIFQHCFSCKGEATLCTWGQPILMLSSWFLPCDYTCVCSEKWIQEIKIQDTAVCATKVSPLIKLTGNVIQFKVLNSSHCSEYETINRLLWTEDISLITRLVTHKSVSILLTLLTGSHSVWTLMEFLVSWLFLIWKSDSPRGNTCFFILSFFLVN